MVWCCKQVLLSVNVNKTHFSTKFYRLNHEITFQFRSTLFQRHDICSECVVEVSGRVIVNDY